MSDNGRDRGSGYGAVRIGELEQSTLDDALLRLRKVEGQVRAVQRMIDEGRDCQDVLRLVGAGTKALRRVGVLLAVSGLEQCITADGSADGGRAVFEQAMLELT